MRHRNKNKILGRKTAPRTSLYKGLAGSLIIHEKIKTTKAKAKAVKPYIERLITKAKEDTLVSRRYLISRLHEKNAVEKALKVIGPRYKERAGGYLRIINMGRRQGDGAEVVQLELV